MFTYMFLYNITDKKYLLELVGGKLLPTVLTLEPFDLQMSFQMFFQVSLLGKGLLAVLIFTNIRSFSGMDPQMFYEIVPFSENFITVFGFAFQNLHVFHCQRVFKFVHHKILSLWESFIYFDLTDIEV